MLSSESKKNSVVVPAIVFVGCCTTLEWVICVRLEMMSWHMIWVMPVLLVFSVFIVDCCFEFAAKNDNMLSKPEKTKKPVRKSCFDRCKRCYAYSNELSMHGLCQKCRGKKDKHGNTRRNARSSEDIAIS